MQTPDELRDKINKDDDKTPDSDDEHEMISKKPRNHTQ